MSDSLPKFPPPPAPDSGEPAPPPPARSVRLPLVLFVLTCLSTFVAGSHLLEATAVWLQFGRLPEGVTLGGLLWNGLRYAACAMTILVCHEMGHYLQARRYGVRTSLPWFIPMPIGPIGTLGAVIGMRSNLGDRRALFDIGITGPLAGLVPTLVFLLVGFYWSEKGTVGPGDVQFGDPLLLKLLVHWRWGTLPPGCDVRLHPMAFAGWFGLLITSLNLIPIGQLDGGHILYALLRTKAQYVASLLLALAMVAVFLATFYFNYPAWWLMVLLLFIMGPQHPPTANDNVPLGATRILLGWFALAFVVLGFTPKPF